MRLNAVIDALEAGVVPPKQIHHLLYTDLVADTMGALETMYRHFGIPMTDAGRGGMVKYLADNPRNSRPVHRFSMGTPEGVARARKVFKRYQDYFNIPSESGA